MYKNKGPFSWLETYPNIIYCKRRYVCAATFSRLKPYGAYSCVLIFAKKPVSSISNFHTPEMRKSFYDHSMYTNKCLFSWLETYPNMIPSVHMPFLPSVYVYTIYMTGTIQGQRGRGGGAGPFTRPMSPLPLPSPWEAGVVSLRLP